MVDNAVVLKDVSKSIAQVHNNWSSPKSICCYYGIYSDNKISFMKRSLKTDIRHNANLVVTGGTAACHSYKLQCSQWRVICHGRDDVIKWKHFRVTGPLCGEFPAQMPVTRGFDIFFDLCLNKRFSKQSWGWWFKTPSCSSWRHCNDDNSEFSVACASPAARILTSDSVYSQSTAPW